MPVHFSNPSALVLIAIAIIGLYVVRRSLANLSLARALVSAAARTLILLLIVLAVAGLSLRRSSRDIALIFVIDVSASVTQDTRQEIFDFINGEIDRAGARDSVGIVAFAREPLVELALTRKESLGEWRLHEINSNPPRDYTDVASALRLSAALIPKEMTGRLLLMSDGNENLESAIREAQTLRASGVEVYTRSIAPAIRRNGTLKEVSVRSLEVPEKLDEGEAYELKVSIDSTTDTDATLRIYRNDSLSSERRVHLSSSGENIFVVPQRADQKGFYSFRAEIEAIGSDSLTQNNSRDGFAVVSGTPKTLYLYGDAQPSAAVARVLSEGRFAATIQPATAAPTSLAGYQDYDLVIFDNVPATSLTPDQMKMVRSYVRDLGGGFVMIGGDQSFGPGGYYKTPIEEALPVSLDVRQKKHLPSLALALVIDKSGSMAGTKMDLTHEAASAAVNFLSERDSVGVIAFDSIAEPIVPLTKVEDRAAIIRQIESIQALGGTNIYPGLQTAYDWLHASDAQIKHIILLSDGRSEGGDFRGIAFKIRESGITLTSVAVGDDADGPLMKMLSDIGNGRFYQTDRPDNLPRIFTREASLASKSTIIEEPFIPKLVRPTQATNGVDWNATPALGGYVATAERDSPSSPAITSLMSDKDDPLYAVWQFGLGRSMAFTSDAKARWSTGWMSWPGFGQFWTQAFRDVLRREAANGFSPRVEIAAGRAHLRVEAVMPDGEFNNNLRLKAHVVAPDFSTSDVTLDQTAAGLYEAEFPATLRGAYLVSVTDEAGNATITTGAVNSYSPEFEIADIDQTLLSRLSEITGGKFIVSSADDRDLYERRSTKTASREIWEALMLAALLLLPIDVGVRRVHLTRDQIQQAKSILQSKLRRTKSEQAREEGAASLARLKSARGRVRHGEDPQAGLSVGSSNSATTEKTIVNPPDEATKSADDKSLGSRLLEAKRKRETKERQD